MWVEGHVPFAAIDELLSERPDVEGISVPGMPAGSPGMGCDAIAVYDVIAWGGTGMLSDEQIVAVLFYIKSRWPERIRRRHDEMNAPERN